jgi:hypothetical protein
VIPVAGVAAPVFDHLLRMTDERGLFEEPRPEHGYCVDDVARGLVVTCREVQPGRPVVDLGRRYLAFVLSALDPRGACHNRMSPDGTWADEASWGDWWGRAVWALGTATRLAPTPGMRARALIGFRVASAARSPHLRAMVFAALGAAEVLESRPDEKSARGLLEDTVTCFAPNGADPRWPWPEPRLTYANATVAEALIVTGSALQDGRTCGRGLDLLEFLLRVETRDGHLSVTPVGGRGPRDLAAGFDQQPIEIAALADACASAFRVTRDIAYLGGIRLAWQWFLGDNDASTPMFDPATGGGYDGLEIDGRNENQGAESTLAMLSTAQQAREVAALW